MNGKFIGKERRRDTRYDFSGTLFFQTTAPSDQQFILSDRVVRKEERPSGRIKNVGEKGCCLTIDRLLEKFQIIKVDFPLLQSLLAIPTLAEIRWVHKELELNQYTVGVRYLL